MSLVGPGLPHLDLKTRMENLQGIEGVQAVCLTYFSLQNQKTEGERGGMDCSGNFSTNVPCGAKICQAVRLAKSFTAFTCCHSFDS